MPNEKTPNRLANEKSPYLLQHKDNPVEWYPWGQEAFDKAKQEDKPIFLSIGYSTCHWCHVMEKESFEDKEVAELLNENYISIKVDREERPDVDHIYMSVCQALTGSGGWPLSIFMAPDRKPFYAGTYFPRGNRMGMQGFISILERISDLWQNNRKALTDSGRQILEAIKASDEIKREDISAPDPELPKKAFNLFKSSFDSTLGGFGTSPKFPTPHNLFFLLRYWHKTRDKEALNMVKKTLDSMHRGGIYDHIGFGFSRYSTDKRWLVPHFEKMLYDNALLAIAYLEGFQASKNTKYSKIAEEIFQYVLRDMTSPSGGFYSAEDADSEGVEGKFYVWIPEEIMGILGEDAGQNFCKYFDITSKGNFEGKNIPNLINSFIPEEDKESVEKSRQILFNHRENRIHPYKDDKILTAWNGLMIAAMAIGGRVLGKNKYTEAAEKAVDFIYKNLFRQDGRLLARYRDDEAAIPAYADDYSFLTWGLIELYETTYNPLYLKRALELSDELLRLFWDEENGGLFIYGSDGEQLITRPKEIYDGALPSGNSVSALNFLKLSRLTGKSDLEDKTYRILKAFGAIIENYPQAYAFSLISMLFDQTTSKEVVIVPGSEKKLTQSLIDVLNDSFRPFTLSVLCDGENQDMEKLIPFIKSYKSLGNKPTAYVCQNFSCQSPVTNPEELKIQLEG